jgi:uncharacterized Tic20 family protein
MTSHPPEPPAQWPPPLPEEGPAGRRQRPGAPEESPDGGGQRPGAPEEWPSGSRRRYPGDRPGNGHRAAASFAANGAPPPSADYPPETGYRPAPGHPSGAGSGPGGYPDLPDYPQNTYSPRDPYFSGYPSMPDYPPMPDYPAVPGHQPTGHPPNGHPADAYPANGYPPDAYPEADQPPGDYPAGGSQVVELPAADGGRGLAAPVTQEEYLHPGRVPAGHPGAVPAGARDALRGTRAPAGPAAPDVAPSPDRTAGPPDVGWAMLGYLSVPLFGFLLPLAVYLTSLRRSRWLRAHAAQAVNLWLTVLLYELSAAITGAMLVLDSPAVALAVIVPLVAALWLTALAFLVRAAVAARRGETYTFPRWLCTPMVR